MDMGKGVEVRNDVLRSQCQNTLLFNGLSCFVINKDLVYPRFLLVPIYYGCLINKFLVIYTIPLLIYLTTPANLPLALPLPV